MRCLNRHNVEVAITKQNKPIRPGVFSRERGLYVVIHFFGMRPLDFECATITCNLGINLLLKYRVLKSAIVNLRLRTSGNGARKMLLKPFKTLCVLSQFLLFIKREMNVIQDWIFAVDDRHHDRPERVSVERCG